MNEFNGTASFGGDVDPILPDGWDGKSDIFADAEETANPIEGADEYLSSDSLDSLVNEEEQTEETAEAAVEEDAAPTTSDVEPEPVAGPTPRNLKLKVNHQDLDVDVSAMSDAELVERLQKSYAFDEYKKREQKATYDKVYQEELDAGMTDRQARYAAEREAGGNFADYEESDEPASVQSEPTAAPQRDFDAELKQLRIIRPEFKQMPDAVAKMISEGVNTTQAYLAWELSNALERENNNQKAAAALKRENEVLKQNAASAARAPVTGVSGGGDTVGRAKTKFEEDFERGFDSANW